MPARREASALGKMCLMGFVRQFQRGDWEVIVEDDDRVAYAYLVREGRIIADVWLYNRLLAPWRPPWNEPGGEMPWLAPGCS
jgi:hypothetical protein